MADGSIRISTKIDTSGAEKDLGKLHKEAEKTADAIEAAGSKVKAVFTGMTTGQLSTEFKKAQKELEKINAELDQVQGEIAAIEAETDKMLPQAKTDDQTKKLLEMEAFETKDLVEKRTQLEQKAEAYEEAMRRITAELRRQKQIEEEKAAHDAALATGGAELKSASADLGFLDAIQSEAQYNQILEQINARMRQIEQAAAAVAQKNGLSVNELLKQNREYQNLAAKQKTLIDNQERYKGKVKETEIATKKWGRTGTQSMRRMTSEINRGIRRLARMSLAMMGVEGVFTIIRRASMQAMENNQTLANQISGIWNILATAIEPVVTRVVNWLTIAITYINAIVKALTGTDLIANANAKALERQAAATEGVTDATYAAAAAQEELQTAGFDEMNKLSDTSSGGAAGGGGAATGDAEGIFQPAEINEDVDGLVKKFKKIAVIAGVIGAAIAGWKIARLLGAPLLKCIGWALALGGTILTIYGLFKMWTDGINWDNLLTTLAGIGAVIGGMALVFGSIGAGIASVVSGVALLVVGIKDLWENGFTWENFATIEAAIALIGGGLSLLTGSWIPIAIAGVVGLTYAIYSISIKLYKDLEETFKKGFSIIAEWVSKHIIEPMKDFFRPLVNAATAAWKWIKENMIIPLRDFFIEVQKVVGEAATIIIAKFREIGAKVKEIFQALWWAFKEYVWKPIREKIITAWGVIKAKVFDPVIEKIKTLWGIFKEKVLDPIKNTFKSLGTWVKIHIIDLIISKIQWLKDKAVAILKAIGTATVDFIKGSIKTVITGVLWSIEKAVNGFIRMLNGAIKLINKIPGVNITEVETMTLPRLARGGIVNNPGVGVPAIIGEAGREAVLPLDRNTEWIDELAARLNGGNGKVVIQLILSGKKIYEEMVDLAQKRNFATNGGI